MKADSTCQGGSSSHVSMNAGQSPLRFGWFAVAAQFTSDIEKAQLKYTAWA